MTTLVKRTGMIGLGAMLLQMARYDRLPLTNSSGEAVNDSVVACSSAHGRSRLRECE